MTRFITSFAVATAVLGLALPAESQQARPTPPAPAPAASGPQRTTATFADWTLGCDHPAGAVVCEVSQVISAETRPVAQIAIGRPARGAPLHLTIAVPPSVTLIQPPRLGGLGKDGPALDLAWRRCLPGACYAEATLPDDVLRQLRTRTDATRIAFLDGAGKDAAIPLSPRGLPQALDALAKEDGS